MAEGFEKLRGRNRLPDPPADTSHNLAAPEVAPAAESAAEQSKSVAPSLVSPPEVAQPKPRIDGRMRLRKDRTEALSTKIKPRHRELLMMLADAYESTLSETLEKAIEALEQQARRDGMHLS